MIKNIFILWFQGLEKAPEVVKRCVESWMHYNKDWNIIILDNLNIKEYISEGHYVFEKKDLEYYEKSDIIRLELLTKYGGVWADSTLFCNKPLDEWLYEHINEGFFAFSEPAQDKSVSNWFLYSERESYILNKWKTKMDDYYKYCNKSWNYFMMHYFFDEIKTRDKEFKEIWERIKHIKAKGPHLFNDNGYFSIDYKIKGQIESKNDPVYKLSHKIEMEEYDKKKGMYYLYSTIKAKKVSELCPALYPLKNGHIIGIIVDN
jgi:hypothetical protein